MIVPTLLLAILGIVVIYSSSPPLAIQQIIFTLIGIGLYFGIRAIDFRSAKELIKPLYIINLILLLVVFFLGVETRGSLRWIPLGPFNFQPSEFAKVVLILTLGDFWSERESSWRNIGLSIALLLAPAILIFRQPDLGTTITLFFIWAVMLIASNISLLKMLIITFSGALFIPLGWFLLRDYQKQRFLSFISPNQDPQGVGYNVIQSTIAIGSGELFGRGLGQGTQSRLRFLPEFRTDFIFASIAEELGLLGSIIVLVLYGSIFYFIFKTLLKSSDRFGELIVVGGASMLFIQIIVNIGMNSGLLPITGITLPLLSYGGSSLITTFIAFGLIASVARFGQRRDEVDTFSL